MCRGTSQSDGVPLHASLSETWRSWKNLLLLEKLCAFSLSQLLFEFLHNSLIQMFSSINMSAGHTPTCCEGVRYDVSEPCCCSNDFI